MMLCMQIPTDQLIALDMYIICAGAYLADISDQADRAGFFFFLLLFFVWNKKSTGPAFK